MNRVDNYPRGVPTSLLKDVAILNKSMTDVEGRAGGELTEQFNGAVDDLFGSNISDETPLESIRGLLMRAFDTGEKFYGEVERGDVFTGEKYQTTFDRANEFLGADRQTSDSVIGALEIVAGHELARATREYNDWFEKRWKDVSDNHSNGTGLALGQVVYGKYKVLRNWGANDEFDRMENRIENVMKKTETIAKKFEEYLSTGFDKSKSLVCGIGGDNGE